MLGMAGGYEYCYIEDMILILEQLFKMQMEVEEPLLPLNNKTWLQFLKKNLSQRVKFTMNFTHTYPLRVTFGYTFSIFF